MTVKILLLENVHPCAREALVAEGFTVDVEKGALSEAELDRLLPNYQALGIRSKTQLSAGLIAVLELLPDGASRYLRISPLRSAWRRTLATRPLTGDLSPSLIGFSYWLYFSF